MQRRAGSRGSITLNPVATKGGPDDAQSIAVTNLDEVAAAAGAENQSIMQHE